MATSCVLYKTLSGEAVPIFVLFEAWYFAKHPTYASEGVHKTAAQDLAAVADVDDRAGFFGLLSDFQLQNLGPLQLPG